MQRDALVAKPEEVVCALRRAAVVDDAAQTVGLAEANVKVEQLQLAIEHRTVLGQATGLVMARYQLTSEAAFKVLARLSQDTNCKLYAIASEIVENHDAETSAAPAHDPVRRRRLTGASRLRVGVARPDAGTARHSALLTVTGGGREKGGA